MSDLIGFVPNVLRVCLDSVFVEDYCLGGMCVCTCIMLMGDTFMFLCMMSVVSVIGVVSLGVIVREVYLSLFEKKIECLLGLCV